MDKKESFIKQLRDLANLLEDKPFDFQAAFFFDVTIFLKCDTEESFKKNALALGTFKKTFQDYWANATRIIGDNIQLQVTAPREVICKKIVTTKIEPATEEIIIPAMPEREVEEVSYECPESIFAI